MGKKVGDASGLERAGVGAGRRCSGSGHVGTRWAWGRVKMGWRGTRLGYAGSINVVFL